MNTKRQHYRRFTILMVGVLSSDEDRHRNRQILTQLHRSEHQVIFATPQLEYPEKFHIESVDFVRRPDFSSLNQFLDAHGKTLDLVILSHLDVAAQHLYAIRRKAPNAFVVFDATMLEFLRVEAATATCDDVAVMRKKAAAMKKIELALMRATDQTWIALVDELTMLTQMIPDINIAWLPYPNDPMFHAESQKAIEETFDRLQRHFDNC